MTKLSTSEIRAAFLEFFEARGHKRVASSSLVPKNDPTLLFTNAGMNQFKDVFTGREERPYRRATTAQKCVRAGGKHNDLDNVGHTARHHTFFEMMGNFSFGDYFKKDAIQFAWELCTERLGIAKDRLAVTIFAGEDGVPRDAEAHALWKEVAHIGGDRLLELGKKDNFWAMGETGPCGPCSELHYHQGDDLPCPLPKCLGPACDCDRWIEIWNLVFMQFERSEGGKLTPLPRPSIDTGAGLERLAAVVQGVRSNYDTDGIRALVAAGERLSGKRYGGTAGDDDVALRVIADHARATAFLVGDGVLPSNEGRGYVLRRIMRRAIRYGTLLGLERPFLHEVCRAVVAEMGEAYPDLRENQAFILEVAQREEEGFRRTLGRGLALIGEAFTEHAADKKLPGEVVFKLYDTYGFPKDLTEILAREKGFEVDDAGYEKSLAEQRARSSEFHGSGEKAVSQIYAQLRSELPETTFLGYEATSGEGRVLAILGGGLRIKEAGAEEDIEVVFDRTPFYGESGGQVGDTGWIRAGTGAGAIEIEISDTQKPVPGLFVHKGRVTKGEVAEGQTLRLQVDEGRRNRIRANHSATHLLHWALKEVLGPHVKQAGSVVSPDYLRFDYSHFSPLTPEQGAEVERLVNSEVRRNQAAAMEELELAAARESGAVALFGEKYGDKVRVIQMGPYSRELCGGTHVSRTGDIGLVKIQSDSAIASGVRRLTALTGEAAVAFVQEEEAAMRKAAEVLKGSPKELVTRVETAARRIRELEQALAQEKRRSASAQSGDLLEGVREIKGVKVLSVTSDVPEPGAMRELADKLRDKLGSGIVVLGGDKDGKALLLVAVTKDLVGKYKAGDLVRELAKEVGGSGGGKPDLAQAGGPDASKLSRALERVYELV